MSFIDSAEVKARCSIEQAAKLLGFENHGRTLAVAGALPGVWWRPAGDRHYPRQEFLSLLPV